MAFTTNPVRHSHTHQFDAGANISELCVNSAYLLPTADGTVNQVLKTNGADVVSWVTPATANAWTGTSCGTCYFVYSASCYYALCCACCSSALTAITKATCSWVYSINFIGSSYSTSTGHCIGICSTGYFGCYFYCGYFVCSASCGVGICSISPTTASVVASI